MKRIISPHDFQLLSEYVDEQLPLWQKTRLEKRLQTNQDLRDTLEELRKNKALLRSLPRMKAPRNFTLTPQLVGRKATRQQQIYRWVPVFQYATVLATFLLILVLAGDILGLGVLLAGRMASKSAADQGVVAMAPQAKSAVATNLVERETQATETAGVEEQTIGPASVAGITTTITNTAPISPTMNEAPLVAQEVPTESPTEQALATGPGQAERAASPPAQGVNLWRWAEISLVVLALAGALITVYLRRQA